MCMTKSVHGGTQNGFRTSLTAHCMRTETNDASCSDSSPCLAGVSFISSGFNSSVGLTLTVVKLSMNFSLYSTAR